MAFSVILQPFDQGQIPGFESRAAEEIAGHVAEGALIGGSRDAGAFGEGARLLQLSRWSVCHAGGVLRAIGEDRDSSEMRGVEVGGIAEEVPSLSALVRQADVVAGVDHVPGLSGLHGHDGVELPSLQELGPGLGAGDGVGDRQGETVVDVCCASLIITVPLRSATPAGSLTVPEMRPIFVWESKEGAANRRAKMAYTTRTNLVMLGNGDLVLFNGRDSPSALNSTDTSTAELADGSFSFRLKLDFDHFLSLLWPRLPRRLSDRIHSRLHQYRTAADQFGSDYGAVRPNDGDEFHDSCQVHLPGQRE